MSESVSVESKEQAHQKPPLSLGRIAGEISAGTAMGFAVAVPISRAIFYLFLRLYLGAPADWPEKGEFGVFGFVALGVWVLSFLMVYGPATVLGVHLVGCRGKQTGSFWATVGGLFLGVPVIALLLLYITMAEGIVKIVLWSLVFLAAPLMETLCFNLTRRYTKPPSP